MQETRARTWSSGTTLSRNTARQRGCLDCTFPTGDLQTQIPSKNLTFFFCTSRRAVEALFLHGLALQMTGQRDLCRAAIEGARDSMRRVIAALPQTEEAEKAELETILGELEEVRFR
jgi:hypothetical protein